MIRAHAFIFATGVALASDEVARADATINFFGDLDYHVVKQDTTNNSFQASSLDIYAMETERNFTFIGELIAQTLAGNDFGVDADRLEVGYKATPWLHVSAGRIRTSIGYYADAYQTGKFFMTPVSWPEMYEGSSLDGFDGIVPAHGVGIHADIARELGNDNGKLTLDTDVLNGRGVDLGEIPAFQDSNNSKAVNFRLRYHGAGKLEGLIVGGNVYVDDIPADTVTGVEHVAMHELILGGHAAYVTERVHAVAELFWFRHREHGTETLHTTLAAFGEAGYAFGDFMPYARVEVLQASDIDPYFTTSGFLNGDHQITSVGVKYAASASVSLKLQASVDHNDTLNAYEAITQAAFAF
jgi:hypothetical protein